MIVSNTHAHSELQQSQVSNKRVLGWSCEVPFFRLQISQAPGIRRFFEWLSEDAIEASSLSDSTISVCNQVASESSVSLKLPERLSGN